MCVRACMCVFVFVCACVCVCVYGKFEFRENPSWSLYLKTVDDPFLKEQCVPVSVHTKLLPDAFCSWLITFDGIVLTLDTL
jgi:hypothetical protein